MDQSELLQQLINALCCLPGVGKKSAQRIAWQLLQHNREGGLTLASVLAKAMHEIQHCRQCRTFSEEDTCSVCRDARRDNTTVCVVENPADAYAVEDSGYRGTYFVLMGHLSPLDGIGPEQLRLDILSQRFSTGDIKEVILATNTTLEGEATAHYISDMAQRYQVKATRIALGVPLGGELEYLDSDTITHALAGRQKF